jgi:hypothetical protein
MGANANRLLQFISETAEGGMVDPVVWRTFLEQFGGANQPLRGQLIGLQLLSEIALIVGKPQLAIDTLEEADRHGLMDVIILDKCPLYEQLQPLRAYRAIRDSVSARAARVLAAFRSTAG